MPFEIAGLRFRNPFLVASGPATKHIDQLLEAERYGWGGVSLKLAIDPAPYINLEPRYRWWNREKYFAFSAEKRLTLDEALEPLTSNYASTPMPVDLAEQSFGTDFSDQLTNTDFSDESLETDYSEEVLPTDYSEPPPEI